jgi:hypothetical protein
MPLASGSDPATISANISELTHHGSRPRNHDQIVAIALSNADKHPHRAMGGTGGIGHIASVPHVAAFHIMHESTPKTPAMHDMTPSQGTPPWIRSAFRQINSPSGGIGHMADGGMAGDAPWWERGEQRIADQPFHSGLIDGSGAGRTDRLPLAVGTDSHVMPADVVSGLGQGNTLAGARILNMALRVGPYGTPLPHEVRGSGPPHPPSAAAMEAEQRPSALQNSMMLAHGGSTHKKVSILAASGEFVVEPELVREIGERMIAGGKAKGSDPMDAGHRYLDDLIHRVRQFNIKWLKNAPPPKT